MIRVAFSGAVASFLATADLVEADHWELPATDEWTVRELFAHTVRTMRIIGEYLDREAPVSEPLIPDAVTYFEEAMAIPGVNASVAARARESARALSPDPRADAHEVAALVLARIAREPADAVVAPIRGRMRLDDYLATRTVELVLHTVDLQLACGLPRCASPEGIALTNQILLGLAGRADPVALACALTGRVGAADCNVLG